MFAPKAETDAVADAAADDEDIFAEQDVPMPCAPEASPLVKDVSGIFKPKDRVSVGVVEQTIQPEDVF